jgi:hypothetical protein
MYVIYPISTSLYSSPFCSYDRLRETETKSSHLLVFGVDQFCLITEGKSAVSSRVHYFSNSAPPSIASSLILWLPLKLPTLPTFSFK